MANGFANTNELFSNSALTGQIADIPIMSTPGAGGLGAVGLQSGATFTPTQRGVDGSVGGIINGKAPKGTNYGGLGLATGLNIGLGLLQGRDTEDIAFDVGATIADSQLPGLGSGVRFGADLAGGMDGREAVAGGIQAGAAALGSIFGGPLVGAGAAAIARPFATDVANFGSSSQATANSIGQRAASYLTSGATDVGRILGIDEASEFGDFIASRLGKTGLFGRQNKASLARESLAKGINNQLEKAGSDIRLNDFYKQFNPGGEIEAKLEELGSRDPESLAEIQKLGQVLGLVSGLDDAGTINVGNMVAASLDGDVSKAKKMFEDLGATPEQLLQGTLEAFSNGKYSVVQTVEAARAIDKAFGTGLAGSEEIKQIASTVEEGGSDRLADGSIFDMSQGEADGLGEDDVISDPMSQTRPLVMDTNESSASIDIGRSNLVDSFSRVQSGNSLTPDKPVNDIRFSMQILRERLESEGKDPDKDETIQSAQRLIQQLQGEFI